MHMMKNETLSQTDAGARAYKRPILRKRDIRSLRRVNHGLYQ